MIDEFVRVLVIILTRKPVTANYMAHMRGFIPGLSKIPGYFPNEMNALDLLLIFTCASKMCNW